MKSYGLKTLEYTKEGFSHCCVVAVADMAAGVDNKTVKLADLVAGDAVLGAMIEVRTKVAGPTGSPTAQVKTGTGAVAITPTCVLTSDTVKGSVTDNTVVGATMVQTGTDTVVLDLQKAAGDGAVPTAGEIWVWLKVSRLAPRTVQA